MSATGKARQRFHDCFVSSTHLDLHLYRDAIRRALTLLRQHPLMMEDFGAQDGDATQVSTQEVAAADLYLLVVGWRYGYVPTGETRSVTHLEYEEAKRLGRPRLIFLAAPDSEERSDLFPLSARDLEHAEQLRGFRAELESERVAAYFSTPEELEREVIRSVSGWLQAHPLPGGQIPRDVPPPVADFIGRTDQLAEVTDKLLAGPQTGLSVAISGMAGVGKSALAAQALRQLAADSAEFPGGITWVRCDGRGDLEGLIWIYDRLLSAWDAPLTPEEAARAQEPEAAAELRERALRSRLRPDAGGAPPSALALLDNVEVTLPLSRLLSTLMALGVTVLLTARHRPNLPNLDRVALDVLAPGPAADLVIRRYVEAGGAEESASDGALAARIADRLGRLPLALELAAAYAALSSLGLARLAGQLDTADRLSPLDDPDDPTRSVRYAFEQSYATLSEAQRIAFAALGLPDGPDWPREVIEGMLAIALSGSAAAPVPAAALNGLAARSLVILAAREAWPLTEADAPPSSTPSAAAPSVRVRLHPLVRDFARELWRALPPERQQAAQDGLMDALAAFVAAHATLHAREFVLLATEEELIAGAARRAAAERVALPQLIALIGSLGHYLNIGGHWQLGAELATLHLDAARALGNRVSEGEAFSKLGYLAYLQGRYAEAAHAYEQALAIMRETGERAGESGVLNDLGLLAVDQSRFDDSERYYTDALAIYRELGNLPGAGAALDNLGYLAYTRDRFEEAQQYYEEALAISRQIGDRQGEGATLDNMAQLAKSQDRYDEAAVIYMESLAIAREFGDRQGEGATLDNLGVLARAQGREEEAAAYYAESLAICQELGDRPGEGVTLSNMALLAEAQGRFEDAIHLYTQALAISREIGDPGSEGNRLNMLGKLAFRQERYADALRLQQEALAIAQRLGDQREEATRVSNVGADYEALGELDHAREQYQRGLVLYEALGQDQGEDARRVRERLARLMVGDTEGSPSAETTVATETSSPTPPAGGETRRDDSTAADTPPERDETLATLTHLAKPPTEVHTTEETLHATDPSAFDAESGSVPREPEPVGAGKEKRRRWWPFGR